ncbi:MAG TPA: lytic transglycosylase domain-containing protein [Pyrinomonadaceae bacterium]|nr:lytic transglycosylase domain-containing protein [Pyrinomonadaceae bacterium]
MKFVLPSRLFLVFVLLGLSAGVVAAQQTVRITLADGYSFEVDEVWKQGEEIWYRKGAISKRLEGSVKKLTPLTKEEPATAKSAPAPVAASAPVAAKPDAEPAPLAIWIYLDGGARMRVDEVNESDDGAWFRRGNVHKFLERDHFVRIEREQPVVGASGTAWKENGWTTGNARIDSLIKVNAARFGVDPYLVFCVIEQESRFKQFARSPKGALGLMQLMPGTARRLGVRRPYDPSENIMGGTRYLKELMTMFGGRVDLVLASYNAGEGAVMKYGRNVPPYRETRDYVKKIGKRYGIDGRKPQEENDVPAPQQR